MFTYFIRAAVCITIILCFLIIYYYLNLCEIVLIVQFCANVKNSMHSVVYEYLICIFGLYGAIQMLLLLLLLFFIISSNST